MRYHPRLAIGHISTCHGDQDQVDPIPTEDLDLEIPPEITTHASEDAELELRNRKDEEWDVEPLDDSNEPLESFSDDELFVAMDEMYGPPDLDG
jgi:hypothetical protein